jgi:hypothetical protein
MPEQVKRGYTVADSIMIEASGDKRDFFIEDLTDFSTYDPEFAAPYDTDWATALSAAAVMPSDETLDDQLTQLTQILKVKFRGCQDKYQDTKHFIEKAFPGNKEVWNEFGYDNYDSGSKSQSRFIVFMYDFHQVAEKYKTELIAKGYSQIRIDEILTLADELKDANKTQNVFRGNIPVQTRNRIAKLNVVWNIMTSVCRVGKRLYKDDYAKFQRYLLPASDEASENFSLRGTVTDSSTSNPIEGVTMGISELGLTTLTDSNGEYGFGALPAGSYTVTAQITGYTDAGQSDVGITAGETTDLDIVMTPVA